MPVRRPARPTDRRHVGVADHSLARQKNSAVTRTSAVSTLGLSRTPKRRRFPPHFEEPFGVIALSPVTPASQRARAPARPCRLRRGGPEQPGDEIQRRHGVKQPSTSACGRRPVPARSASSAAIESTRFGLATPSADRGSVQAVARVEQRRHHRKPRTRAGGAGPGGGACAAMDRSRRSKSARTV